MAWILIGILQVLRLAISAMRMEDTAGEWEILKSSLLQRTHTGKSGTLVQIRYASRFVVRHPEVGSSGDGLVL
jgi:hypothetical protein